MAKPPVVSNPVSESVPIRRLPPNDLYLSELVGSGENPDLGSFEVLSTFDGLLFQLKDSGDLCSNRFTFKLNFKDFAIACLSQIREDLEKPPEEAQANE